MARLLAALLLASLAAAAEAKSVTCPDGKGGTVEREVVATAAPEKCPGEPPRDLCGYSKDLIASALSESDEKFCTCYYTAANKPACHVTRNYIKDVADKKDNGRVPCLADLKFAYPEEQKSMLNKARQAR
jgi:hypothetical protein